MMHWTGNEYDEIVSALPGSRVDGAGEGDRKSPLPAYHSDYHDDLRRLVERIRELAAYCGIDAMLASYPQSLLGDLLKHTEELRTVLTTCRYCGDPTPLEERMLCPGCTLELEFDESQRLAEANEIARDQAEKE